MSNSQRRSLLLGGERLADVAYLNTAAEGIPYLACAQSVQRYLNDKATGEPGRVSMWREHEKCRRLAGNLFAVEASQIALVSSTTEALNIIANGIPWSAGDEVVFTSVEFPSNMYPWVALQRQGVVCRVVHPRDGLVRLEDVLSALSPKTRLVTVSQVSYATGQHIDPVPIWDAVQRTGALLCVDATQAAGRVGVRGDIGDFVVASAFKWLGSIHGSAILSVGRRAIERDVLGPAGWLSAVDLYAPDRLEKFHPRGDAGRFQAGMPNFDSVYALAAALEQQDAEAVAARPRQLEPLVVALMDGLLRLGLEPLTPRASSDRAGIVAFRRPAAAKIKSLLAERAVHIHADDGRVRAAVHWYNDERDIERYLDALGTILRDKSLSC